MRNTMTILLILISLIAKAQMIITIPCEAVYQGKNVYQIVIADSTVKTLHWVVLSGTGKGEGNDGLAFCFGHPKNFNARIPDTTGVLYVYNPKAIYERGSSYVWKIKIAAVEPEKNRIVYRGWEELMFPNLTELKTNPIEKTK